MLFIIWFREPLCLLADDLPTVNRVNVHKFTLQNIRPAVFDMTYCVGKLLSPDIFVDEK